MLTVIIAILGFAIDRAAKILTQLYVQPVHSITVIEGIFSFTYVENRGAAHGILQGQRWFLIGITIIIAALLIVFMVKNYSRAPLMLRVSGGMILGGAFGNLFDRIFYGYVVDMLQVTFIDYPVFNPADNLLVFGVIVLGIYILFFDKEFFVDKKKIDKDKSNGEK